MLRRGSDDCGCARQRHNGNMRSCTTASRAATPSEFLGRDRPTDIGSPKADNTFCVRWRRMVAEPQTDRHGKAGDPRSLRSWAPAFPFSEGPVGGSLGGRVDHGHSAVAEGVRAATASNIGANPTLRPRAFGGRSPSSLRNASHGWPQGVETTQTIRLPHHDLYAGRGKPASPYGVSDDDGLPRPS